jgi:hypothetical protein
LETQYSRILQLQEEDVVEHHYACAINKIVCRSTSCNNEYRADSR